jgi:tetratricopeptide (TPR) repeat protein
MRERSGLDLALYARVNTRASRVALLEDAVRREPDCAYTHFFLGWERLRLMELEPARDRLRRALELDPELAAAWIALARLRVRELDFTGAAEATRRYLEKCPLDAIHWFKLGHYLQSTGEEEQAVEAYREAIRIRPAAMRAAIRRRDVLITEEQRRRFERPWSIGYQARINLADLWIEDGQLPRAIALLKKAVALDPERPEAHYTLGVAHERLARADAGRRDPASRSRRAGHLEKAGRHWRRYLELGGARQERVRGWLEKLREEDPDPF